MSYAPEADPRYIPPVSEPEEPDRAAARERVEIGMEQLALALGVFQHPGWPHIEATLEKELADAKDRMFRIEEPLVFREVKGQVYAFEWLLSLKERAQSKLQALDEQLHELETGA